MLLISRRNGKNLLTFGHRHWAAFCTSEASRFALSAANALCVGPRPWQSTLPLRCNGARPAHQQHQCQTQTTKLYLTTDVSQANTTIKAQTRGRTDHFVTYLQFPIQVCSICPSDDHAFVLPHNIHA